MIFLNKKQTASSLKFRGVDTDLNRLDKELLEIIHHPNIIEWENEFRNSFIASKNIIDGFSNSDTVLLVFLGRNNFPSLQDWNLLERLLISFNQRHGFFDRPGILFEPHDIFHLRTFVSCFLSNRLSGFLVDNTDRSVVYLSGKESIITGMLS